MPAGSATLAVPPGTIFVGAAPVELELLPLELHAAATKATTATAAAAPRRSLRLPRCIFAPLSWRAGARGVPCLSCWGDWVNPCAHRPTVVTGRPRGSAPSRATTADVA